MKRRRVPASVTLLLVGVTLLAGCASPEAAPRRPSPYYCGLFSDGRALDAVERLDAGVATDPATQAYARRLRADAVEDWGPPELDQAQHRYAAALRSDDHRAALQSPDVVEAVEQIDAWLIEHCPTPPATTPGTTPGTTR